ncbi:MAG: polysaccharide deacetylase family protein [Clostridia bacterium]|nr:polysaccharide deacetylase family protein [Clostridia bacterium]
MRIISFIFAIIVSISSMPTAFADSFVTMYASDGRTLLVATDEVELYGSVGWYEHIYDVVVPMYDTNGAIQSIYTDDAFQKLKEGYTYAESETTELMFADDGRVIYVPHAQVGAYLAVNWYRGGGKLDISRPMLAITFDDGPAKYTETILACLEKYGARATFFVQGKSISRYPETVKHAVAIGCEIGNHTWGHANLSKSTASEIREQIESTNNAVFEVAGVYPKLFRPPYGAYNSAVLSAADKPAIMWSVDTLDWKTRNTEKTVASIKSSAKDGSIILMHDIHAPTAPAAEQIIPYLLKQGYQLVTVSELLEARKGGAQVGKAYGNGY